MKAKVIHLFAWIVLTLACWLVAWLLWWGFTSAAQAGRQDCDGHPCPERALAHKTLHNFYWLTVWDNTYDPLGYLWLVVPIVAVLFCAVMLSITLPGRTKLASLMYLLLIPALITVSALAQSVDFRELTEERAERVSQTIEAYHAREGHYPRDLRQLTPWYIFSLPVPVIINGQEWCYEGGDDHYRLGYVYRQHWSDPRLSGQTYSTKGQVPDLGLCEQEVIALQVRYPDYPYEYWTGGE